MKQVAQVDTFLKATLPGYQYKSRKARDKLLESFEFLEYIKGVTLIREGESTASAYFIMEGEVKLIKKSVEKPGEEKKPVKSSVNKLPRLSDM